MISLDIINADILDLETNRDTTWVTVERLAWLYIVRDHLNGAPTVQPKPLEVSGDSEFITAVANKDSVKVFAIMDELMNTTRAINPRLYDAVMFRIGKIE